MDINDIRPPAGLANAIGKFQPPAGLSAVETGIAQLGGFGALANQTAALAAQQDAFLSASKTLREAGDPMRRLGVDFTTIGKHHIEASKVLSEALKINAGAGFGVDLAKLVAGFTPTLPKLPEIPSYIPEPTWLAESCRPVYSIPPLPALDDTVDERISDLERRLEKVEAQRAETAELQALRAENKRLRQQNRLFKQRLEVPVFKNLGEYDGPDLPPDETRFSID